MATQSKGKKFEQQIREDFEKVLNVSIDRLPDQTMRYRGATNVSDFIVYKEPYEYYIECKTTKGASLSFNNIKDGQWDKLPPKSEIQGVFAGILCWFYDKDVTKFIPIQLLQDMRDKGLKSVRYDIESDEVVTLKGKKKRTFYTYDMEDFFNQMEKLKRR